jgi:transglutaminase-like putative cysteine protease
MLIKKLLFFALSFMVWGWHLVHPSLISADQNFATQLISTYTVPSDPAQAPITEHKLLIINKTPTLFITQYAWKLSGNKELKDIQVFSNGKAISPNIIKTDDQTSIGITFPDQIVGEGKQREVVIRYHQPELVVRTGQVMQTYVPTLANPETFDSYQVKLKIPAHYESPVRINPQPTNVQTDNNTQTFTFSNVGKESVVALFGKTQVFSLGLKYHLENTSNNVGLIQIALPPDTPYQKLNYTQLDPQPKNLAIDDDGNWIATYQLAANHNQTVHIEGQVKVTLDPDLSIPRPPTQDSLISEQEFWETSDSKLKELAAQYQNPRDIYDYVVEALTYTKELPTEPTRLGARKVLDQPNQATCQEFTDLFVTLSRINRIPARRITGFAYAQHDQSRPVGLVEDILHAWPEYYDTTKNQWVAVDPTWGDTTGGVDYFTQFDLNHVVFAINGLSSSSPYPAGSYKFTNQNTKDVSVELTEDFPTITPNFSVTLKPKKIFGIEIPGWYEWQFSNQTGQAWYDIKVTQESDFQTLPALTQQEVVLPYQKITKNIVFFRKNWSFSSQPITLHTHHHDQTQTFQFNISSLPSFSEITNQEIILIGVGISSVLIALTTGSVLVFRRTPKRSVRR